MSNFICLFDVYFRNSLYHQNKYHIHNKLIDNSLLLSKSNFSFNNIHMKFGSVRWCTTINTKYIFCSYLNFILCRSISTKHINTKKTIT